MVHFWHFVPVPTRRFGEDCTCQAKPQGSPGKLGQVRAFKRKLEDRSGQLGQLRSGRTAGAFVKESLRAGIIDPGEGQDGRVKRKAAAVADERLKAQIAMERGVLRERAPKARLASARCIPVIPV